ncbi:MAG: PD-(D/E)XK nuclease family protein [Porticoccaceae bacterium]
MLNPLFDIGRARDAIAAGALVLTPNLRLARKIRDAWDGECLGRGESTWLAPSIFALDSWLDDCWQQLVDGAWPPALAAAPARPAQQQWLWEQVLAEDDSAGANPRGFAELAQRGWRLAREWQLPLADLAREPHEGARALVRWGLAWEGRLARHGLASGAEQLALVRRGFAEGALPRLPRILLAGFQSLAPLHEDILKVAAHRLEELAPPAPSRAPRAVACQDPEREIASAARWAMARARRDPAARIGIVVPDLAALRNRVERVFLHHLEPDWCWPDQPYRPLPFNLSAASPLVETPLVAAALDLLALNRQRLAVDQLARVLNSPFWGRAAAEGPARAGALVALLDAGLAEPPTSLLRRVLENALPPRDHDPEASPASRLTRLADSLRQGPRARPFGAWRALFEHQLDALGWPGERPLNSLEYQVREHWATLLDEFATLDNVASTVTLEEALGELQRLATNAPFQAETPDAQIQILGTLEAAGLQFDHLRVLQLDDRHWPESTAPHPLLPVALQRARGMPRASPERELALGRALFDLFGASAGEVVFSHALQDGDIHLQPSALLAGLEYAPDQVEDPFHPWIETIRASARLELVDDRRGPPLAPPPGPLPRASGFLAAQAGCPFNAFAAYRLGAEPLPGPTTGLDALARGNLIHYSLEALWRDLGNQGALAALGDDERRHRIAAAIDDAFARFLRRSPVPPGELGERHLALERARIAALLDRWLTWELARPAFSVEGLELDSHLDLDGFAIRMRIDRVDRQGSGGLVIIDYKTGASSLSGLASERLLSPQLALYALAATDGLAALGYGQINARTTGFSGLARDGNLLPGARGLAELGLPDTWQDTLNEWRNKLIELKNEICNGDAPLVFHSREAATYGGDFAPLNRWQGWERIARLKARGAVAELTP